jgi:dihydroflavonol-4-reductase
MSDSPRRVALTGVSGFVGTHLAKGMLARGIEVRALVRKAVPWLPAQHPGFTLVHGDIRSPQAARRLLEGADALFHTAAVVAPWVPRPSDLLETNIGGTQVLLEEAAAREIPSVVTNSIVALDPYPPPRMIRLFDHNYYLESKRATLDLIRKDRQRGQHVTALLPSGIVGPFDHRPTAIGRVIREAMAGKAPPISFSGGMYLIDVRDVAEAHFLAVQATAGDYVLPGEFWSLDRLYSFVAALAGRQPHQVQVPAWLAMSGAALLTAWSKTWTRQPPLITPAWVYSFHHAGSRNYPDDTDRLGLTPRPVADAITDAASWFAESAGHA